VKSNPKKGARTALLRGPPANPFLEELYLGREVSQEASRIALRPGTPEEAAITLKAFGDVLMNDRERSTGFRQD